VLSVSLPKIPFPSRFRADAIVRTRSSTSVRFDERRRLLEIDHGSVPAAP
jgi:hypothetical protein